MRKQTQHSEAFTSVEVTVVILIIIILMGFIFTASQGVLDRSRKVQAKNDRTRIVTAVNAYYVEYGKYPLADFKQGCDTLAGDPGGTYDNAFILNVLRAIPDSNWNSNNVLNPREIVFFQGTNVKDPLKPKGGFATQDTTSASGSAIKAGGFCRSMGRWLVSIDGDYDSYTREFIAYTDLTYTTTTSACAGTWPTVGAGCFATSWGKDGKHGKNGDHKYSNSDDVLSWQ